MDAQILNITKGEWKCEPSSNEVDFLIKSNTDFNPIAETCEDGLSWQYQNKERAEANFTAICNAVNNTYGKGINPESIPDIQKQLTQLKELNAELLGVLKEVDEKIKRLSEFWWIEEPDRGGFDTDKIRAAIAKAER